MNIPLRIVSPTLLLLISQACAGQSLCFDAAADNRYETLANCNRIVAVDFDNDGHEDVLSATNGSPISLNRGNGDGTFMSFEPIGWGGGKEFLYIDISNDGIPDILRIGNSGGVLAQLNNGDGTFADGIYTEQEIGNYNNAELGAGDVTGDGLVDAVINDSGNDVLYIMKGDGAGNFPEITALPTLDGPGSIDVDDLNADGNADIVCNYIALDQVSIFISDGDNTFTQSNQYSGTPVGESISSIEIADIDGDELKDILMGGMAVMYVLSNNGNGTFTSLPDIGMGSYAYGFIMGDWDDDGDLDPAWANGSGGGVTIVNSLGDGTIETYSTKFYSAGAWTEDVASGDFDEDGAIDLVTANGYPGNFTFMHGHGDLRFGPLDLLTAYGASGFAVADFNQDGNVDVLATNYYFSELALSVNNGDGSFSETQYFDLGPYSVDELTVADFNGDNFPDVATHGSSGFIISINDGNGGFENPIAFTSTVSGGGGDRTICSGYFNNDQFLDLAGTYVNTDELAVVFGDGEGGFSVPLQLTAGDYPRTIDAGDLNNDGWDDIIICSNLTDEAWIFFAGGDGTFETPVQLSVGLAPEGITVLEATGDNMMDLAVACPNSNDIYLFPGTNGGFETPVLTDTPTSSNTTRLTNADINADGITDLVACLSQVDHAGVFFGNGDGTFQPAISFNTDRNPSEILCADFNDDGAMDISTVNQTTNNVSVILNNAAFIAANGELAFCEGESVELTASSNVAYSYLWNDVNASTTPSINVSSPGTYYCAITNQSGTCTLITTEVTVEVFQSQSVSLELDSTVVCIEDNEFYLTGGSPFGGLYSGIGVVSNIFNPEVAGVGTFTITYAYEDAGSCTNASATDVISVEICNAVDDLSKLDISVFPTITTSFVWVKCEDMLLVQLYDLNGRMIQDYNVVGPTAAIDLSSISQGVYILQIAGENSTHISRIQKINE